MKNPSIKREKDKYFKKHSKDFKEYVWSVANWKWKNQGCKRKIDYFADYLHEQESKRIWGLITSALVLRSINDM
tara:strand:+ start:974 stop:1195 length:222 start_codon:yes stop_codon:yes gene_type:complete